ncbi:hypothetical protein IAR50_006159 [Cryptococcus sp. DSM 104548]
MLLWSTADPALFDVSGIYFRHLDEPSLTPQNDSSLRTDDVDENLLQWDLVNSCNSIYPPITVYTNTNGPARRSSAPSDLSQRRSSGLGAGRLSRARTLPESVRYSESLCDSLPSHSADTSPPTSVVQKEPACNSVEKPESVTSTYTLDASDIVHQSQLDITQNNEERREKRKRNEGKSFQSEEIIKPHPDFVSPTLPSITPFPVATSFPATLPPPSPPRNLPQAHSHSPMTDQNKDGGHSTDKGYQEPCEMEPIATPRMTAVRRTPTPDSEGSASAATRAAVYQAHETATEAIADALSKACLSDTQMLDSPDSTQTEAANNALSRSSADPVPTQLPPASSNNPNPLSKLTKNQKKHQKKKKRQSEIAGGLAGYWWIPGFVSPTSDDETLFAARDLARGRICMWEFPVAITDSDFDSKTADAIHEENRNDMEDKEVLDALPNQYPDLGIYGAFLTNSLPLGTKGRHVVLAQISALGRACDPNAHFILDEATHWTYVIALKDIAQGEPLTIRHPEGFNTSSFRTTSFHKRGVDCHCSLCRRNSTQTILSDANRLKYSSLNRAFLSSFPTSPCGTLLNMIQGIILLLAHEGFWEMLCARFLDEFVVCAAFGDEKSAREWAEGARDAACLVQWYGGEEWRKIKAWSENSKSHPVWGKRGSGKGWGPGKELLGMTLGGFNFEDWSKDVEKPLGKYAYLPEG